MRGTGVLAEKGSVLTEGLSRLGPPLVRDGTGVGSGQVCTCAEVPCQAPWIGTPRRRPLAVQECLHAVSSMEQRAEAGWSDDLLQLRNAAPMENDG